MRGLESLVTDQQLGSFMMRVRKRTKAVLALRDLTQEKAGEQLGLSKAQVSGMLNAGNPTLRTLLVLAQMGGMSLEQLVREMPDGLEGQPGIPART